MRIRNGLIYLCLMLSLNAWADVTSDFSLVSDYVFRGQTQTNHLSAVQGGLSSSFYGVTLGAWASSVASAEETGAEGDLYLDYQYEINNDLSLSIGALFYYYPFAVEQNTSEASLSLQSNIINASLHFSPKYFGAETSAIYILLNRAFYLNHTKTLAFDIQLGNTSFGDEIKAGNKDHIDYKFTLSHKVGELSVGIFHSDTNRILIDEQKKTSSVKDEVFGITVTREVSEKS